MKTQSMLRPRFAAALVLGFVLLAACARSPSAEGPAWLNPPEDLLEHPGPYSAVSFPEAMRFVPRPTASGESAFQVMSPMGGLLFHSQGFTLGIAEKTLALGQTTESVPIIPIHVRFVGSSQEVALAADHPFEGEVNIFQGQDVSAWRSQLPTFGALKYTGLYPGIDLHFGGSSAPYGGTLQLKGTFVVAAGANTGQIRWRYDGAETPQVGAGGDLIIPLGAENRGMDGDFYLTEKAPIAWQEVEGRRVPVKVAYQVAEDGTVSFDIAGYQQDQPLIIDPTLEYSTYLGGSGVDEIFDVIVDPARSTILVGASISVDYPTDNPISEELVGSRNVVVSKISRNGNVLEFSTFLGGGSDDVARSVAVDVGGDIYIVGQTFSEDFPTTQEPQAPEDGGGNVFLTKLSLSGSSIRYSVVLGGSEDEDGLGVAADSAGNAYIAGITESDDLPTINPIQSSFGGGTSDGFIARLNAIGNEYAYITYLGGTGADSISSIAIDRRSSVYVTGFTTSIDLPTRRPVQAELQGDQDAFVVKLLEDGLTFDYATYLGVGDRSSGADIVVDRDDSAYVAGTVESQIGDQEDRGSESFVIKLNEDGSRVDFQTVFGGSGEDEASGIGIDRDRNIFVTGLTESEDLQSAALIQPGYGGNGDGYIAQLTANGSLVTQNYVGGSDFDQGLSISVFGSGDAVVAGITFSPDFPTLNPLQSTYRGAGDAFLLLIEDVEVVPTPVPTNTPEPTPLPPPPTPEPTAVEALVESNEFLYGILGLIGLVLLLLIFESIRGSRRRKKRNQPPDLF